MIQDVRARPVVGLSLARVPAIRPVTLHCRARAREHGPLQPPTTATVPTTTSASTTRSTSRLDRSCMRPSPVPTTRLQISRTDAVEQSACTLHANSCWLAGRAAAGCRRPAPCARLRLCPAARDRDTKALGQLFQVPVVLSRME
jgi:hypothetical protein